MDRWVKKVAIVTGASSGIGQAISKVLVQNGVKVVGLARRLEKMEDFRNEVKNEQGDFFPIKCDLSKEEDILCAINRIRNEFKNIDILVNNAGVLFQGPFIESSTESYRRIFDVNVIAPAIFTREIVKLMKENKTAGHIINISSVYGKSTAMRGGLFYNLHCPSKFALTAMTQILEQELQNTDNPIKVTAIHPGLVKTEMTTDDVYKHCPSVDPEDIADGIIYALSTPPHVQVTELTISPVPGYRRVKS